ncbi:MAG TPA: HD domain-containing protein [Chloroflexota bacterium]|nr:HD domain-containing protein [Chloroflexota bacterium]
MTLSVSHLTKHDREVLTDLEALVQETYQLWDEVWVGFSWRNYTFDHVMRVRNLARTIAEREGGDMRALEFAATLHDITKSFDGEILLQDGKRVLDEDGFWLNEKLPPARRNRVVDLYDNLSLAGTVHHVSGGKIATELLLESGYDEEFCGLVREIIAAHLKPRESTSAAGLSLYDADTIDANIGLPAFYRNIQISMHRFEADMRRKDEDLDSYLVDNLQSYLDGYLGERIPVWVTGKRDDFIAKLSTDAGRSVARDRIEYLSAEVGAMHAELADYAMNVERGRLAIVKRFLTMRDNPRLSTELAYLNTEWQALVTPTREAEAVLQRYEREVSGAK